MEANACGLVSHDLRELLLAYGLAMHPCQCEH